MFFSFGKALLGVMKPPPWCKTVVSGCEVRTICQKPPLDRREERLGKAKKHIEPFKKHDYWLKNENSNIL